MVVAIFCGHPDNLEDSDESERKTVAFHGSLAKQAPTTGAGGRRQEQETGA